MKIRSFIVTCLLLCALVLPAVAAVSWQVNETTENGVPVVINPDVPRDGAASMTAREAWRLGADEENDPLLGRITDIVTDAAGNSFLLDADMSHIQVVGPAGELLRTIGREGDGPGEFRNASELVFMPDGNVGVLEMMPGNVVVMDLFGEPRDSFRPGGDEGSPMMLPQHIAAGADGIVLGHVSTSLGSETVVTAYTLARYLPDGTEAAKFIERKEEQSGGEISLSLGGSEDDFTRSWILCNDGSVVVFRYAFAYELQVFGPDGVPARTIRREYETLRRSQEELAAARRQAEEMNARFPGVTQEVEERSRDISTVHPRPGGELWVATSAGDLARPEGLGIFDVFDAAGLYVRTLRIDGVEYDPERDQYLIEGDRLFVLREAQVLPPRTTTSGGGGMQMVMIQTGAADPEDDTESGPHEVVCYELDD